MKRFAYLTAVVLGCVLSASAFGQNAGGGNNPGGAPGGGQGGGRNRGGADGGGRDWRAEWNNRIKEQLGATDEEFKALQPKIEKVQTIQRQQMAGRFGGGFGGRGGRGPGGGDQPAGGQPGAQPGATTPPANPVADAATALRTTLDNKDATAADIKAKLDALRAAKAKSHDELVAAQKELKELLSQRQEAVLVQMGILE